MWKRWSGTLVSERSPLTGWGIISRVKPVLPPSLLPKKPLTRWALCIGPRARTDVFSWSLPCLPRRAEMWRRRLRRWWSCLIRGLCIKSLSFFLNIVFDFWFSIFDSWCWAPAHPFGPACWPFIRHKNLISVCQKMNIKIEFCFRNSKTNIETILMNSFATL